MSPPIHGSRFVTILLSKRLALKVGVFAVPAWILRTACSYFDYLHSKSYGSVPQWRLGSSWWRRPASNFGTTLAPRLPSGLWCTLLWTPPDDPLRQRQNPQRPIRGNVDVIGCPCPLVFPTFGSPVWRATPVLMLCGWPPRCIIALRSRVQPSTLSLRSGGWLPEPCSRAWRATPERLPVLLCTLLLQKPVPKLCCPQTFVRGVMPEHSPNRWHTSRS